MIIGVKMSNKSEFKTDLISISYNDKYNIIYEPLEYYSKILNDTIIIPKYFYTDFASVRRLPLIYLFFGGVAKKAASVHDYLYRKNCSPIVDRKTADKIFYEAMKVTKVWRWRRWPMYLAVRLFGKKTYHVHKVLDKIV